MGLMSVMFWVCLGAAVASLFMGADVHFAGELVAAGLFAIAAKIEATRS